MTQARKRRSGRQRVGQVSYYRHHGGWWIYYREGGQPVRRRVAETEQQAAAIAAQVNAQLATAAPTQFSFAPISVSELRAKFLDHHEHILRSSVATVRRYRAATRHLEQFAAQKGHPLPAHKIDAEEFVRHLRMLRVAPNGHANARRRPLRDKGVRYILETCRSMYGYAARKRHLPPYAENSFAGLGLKRVQATDAKPIFVFDEAAEQTFFDAVDNGSFPIHFTLAKTGLRTGEAAHLLIEDLDLEYGWLRIHNKSDLGWWVKTGRERCVPLHPAVVAVLRFAIADRQAGPVFLRPRFTGGESRLAGRSRHALACALERRIQDEESRRGAALPREHEYRIARTIWRDAGALKSDHIRQSFVRWMAAIGRPQATCPKSWRHTFATLLQDANVDPLIRQITLGHAPNLGPESALGMTGVYTHTRSATQRREVLRAIELWPQSLQIAFRRTRGEQ
jgi:integrase